MMDDRVENDKIEQQPKRYTSYGQNQNKITKKAKKIYRAQKRISTMITIG